MSLLVAPAQEPAAVVQSRPRPRTVAIDLYGRGQVGRALLERAGRQGVPVRSVLDSKGVVAAFAVPDAEPVFVDCTAPHYSGPSAERWIRQLETTLRSGVHVATCNKAPLALAWQRLDQAARAGGACLVASATVGAGTPVLRTIRRLHEDHGVAQVEAVVSGTLSHVVRDLSAGASLGDAVRGAQAAGLAEPDPTLDLNGTDALAKGVIVHNTVFRDAAAAVFAPQHANLSLREDGVQAIVDAGEVPEVVVRIRRGTVDVALEGRPPQDRLATRPGAVGVHVRTLDGATYRIEGPGAGPAVTAAAVLGDVSSLRERLALRPGIGP